jgi:hypothetical protein
MRNLARFISVASFPLLAACGGTTIASTPTDGGAGEDSGNDTGSPPPVTCAAPLMACNGVCVATQTDPDDCGGCGVSCGVGGSCVQGSCATTQPASGGTFAIHTLYLGDSDRNGVQSSTAWEAYGQNIDGKATTAASTDVCTLYPGAAREAQVDGMNGIDNSFGENIVPILITIAGSNYASEINAAIDGGQLGTQIFGLGAFGGATSPYSGELKADSLSTPPTWSGSDVWPIDSSSVNGSVASPIVTFLQSTLTGDVWTSGPTGAASANFAFVFPAATIPVGDLEVTMTVAPDGSSATNGTISGVMNTAQFIAAFEAVAGDISTSLCSGTAVQSIATQLEQASDILSDGSNQAGVACDAISLGLGFDAIAAKLGAVVTPTPPANPCSP